MTHEEKQIEEIAYDVCNSSHCTVEEWQCCSVCAGLCEKAKRISGKLIDKGYRKSTELAEEIFAEIEKAIATIKYTVDSPRYTHIPVETMVEVCNWILQDCIPKRLAELKKKYTEGGV